MTLKNFIRCYGEKVGTEKYLENNNKFKSGYSAISQELFWAVYKKLRNKDKIYFGELNKEFNKNDFDRGYYYDFVCTKRKKVIEFNGDMWHANPAIYTEHEIVNPYKNDTAKQMWEKDRIKIDFIKTFGYDVLIIWESEYTKNKEAAITKCLNFLNNK
jgi:very-short-patch-repair endonuclease